MKQILIVKPGTLSDEDRSKLSSGDIIVIEHPNPEEVRVITEITGLKGDDVLQAALAAISRAGSISREYFGAEFIKRFVRP